MGKIIFYKGDGLLTVLPDFPEEEWHSMDLCAEMLLKYCPPDFSMKLSFPKYRKIFSFLPGKTAKNMDRLYNRWISYPKHVQSLGSSDGFFHLVDHSYSHLLHYLPDCRVGIYCHDLDAFRSILNPSREPRPKWYRLMMGKVFDGFKKARIVFCNSQNTKMEISKLGIWKDEDVVLAPLGVAEEFTQHGLCESGNYLLHVGSCIPRKRIDLLLNIFAKLSAKFVDIKLIQAGGKFTASQSNLIDKLGIRQRVEQRCQLSRLELAKLYRGARCLLVTSEQEGFGLPVIEALSCGCPVFASDIPSLREAGREFAFFSEMGNTDIWVEKIKEFLLDWNFKLNNLGVFNSWAKHVEIIANTYERLDHTS